MLQQFLHVIDLVVGHDCDNLYIRVFLFQFFQIFRFADAIGAPAGAEGEVKIFAFEIAEAVHFFILIGQGKCRSGCSAFEHAEAGDDVAGNEAVRGDFALTGNLFQYFEYARLAEFTVVVILEKALEHDQFPQRVIAEVFGRLESIQEVGPGAFVIEDIIHRCAFRFEGELVKVFIEELIEKSHVFIVRIIDLPVVEVIAGQEILAFEGAYLRGGDAVIDIGIEIRTERKGTVMLVDGPFERVQWQASLFDDKALVIVIPEVIEAGVEIHDKPVETGGVGHAYIQVTGLFNIGVEETGGIFIRKDHFIASSGFGIERCFQMIAAQVDTLGGGNFEAELERSVGFDGVGLQELAREGDEILVAENNHFLAGIGFSHATYTHFLSQKREGQEEAKKEEAVFFPHSVVSVGQTREIPAGTNWLASPPLRTISRMMVEFIAESSATGKIKMVSISGDMALFI